MLPPSRKFRPYGVIDMRIVLSLLLQWWWWLWWLLLSSGVVVSALASINEVNQRQARLVLRWMTVSGLNSRCVTFIPVCSQLPRSTQPGHPFVGRHNDYQPKGRWCPAAGSTDKEWFVCEWRVKLCDPLVTHGPRLSCTIPVLCDSLLYVNCSGVSAILLNGDYFFFFFAQWCKMPKG